MEMRNVLKKMNWVSWIRFYKSKIDPLIIFTFAIAFALRFGHLFFIKMDEPFRLGGLFLEFSEQIIKNHYLLPARIPYYSYQGLPFAYPPLSFYFQAVILDLFNFPKIVLVNLIPPIFSGLGVISFYFLAKNVFSKKVELISSLLAFSLMPSAFNDHLEAAGLPESFGTLAIIWYAFFLFELWKKQKPQQALIAGIFLAICVISSPGSAYASALLSVIFALVMFIQFMNNHSMKAIALIFIVAGVGISLSAPYWLTVMIQNGKGVFISPFLAQHQGGSGVSFIENAINRILGMNISGGKFGIFWNTFIFLGFLISIFNKQFILPLSLLSMVVIPREGGWLAPIFGSLLVGVGIAGFLSKYANGTKVSGTSNLTYKASYHILFLAFLFLNLYSSITTISNLFHDRQLVLKAWQIESLEDARVSIPESASVVLIGNDAFNEWGPTLLKREVINVSYGLEWEPFEQRKVNQLNAVIESGDTLSKIFWEVKNLYNLETFFIVSNDKQRINELIEGNTDTIILPKIKFDSSTINVLMVSEK